MERRIADSAAASNVWPIWNDALIGWKSSARRAERIERPHRPARSLPVVDTHARGGTRSGPARDAPELTRPRSLRHCGCNRTIAGLHLRDRSPERADGGIAADLHQPLGVRTILRPHHEQ